MSGQKIGGVGVVEDERRPPWREGGGDPPRPAGVLLRLAFVLVVALAIAEVAQRLVATHV